METTTKSTYISNLRNRHDTLVEEIKQLQEVERAMYQNLEAELMKGNENEQVVVQEQITARIEDLKSVRISLLSQLKGFYNDAREKLRSNKYSLSDQLTFLQVVEDELDQARENIQKMKGEKNNRIRLVQIGTYEQKRYQSYIKVLKYIILFAVISMVLYMAIERGLIPRAMSGILAVVIGLLAVYFILGNVYDINRRDNFDFDKYQFPADLESLSKIPIVHKTGSGVVGGSSSSTEFSIFDTLFGSSAGKCLQQAKNAAQSSLLDGVAGAESVAAESNDALLRQAQADALADSLLSAEDNASAGEEGFKNLSSECDASVRLEHGSSSMVSPVNSAESLNYSSF